MRSVNRASARVRWLVILLLAVLLLASFAGSQHPPAAGTTADLILYSGKIITVDAKNTIAEAIAIRDGRILAVGKNADVLKLKDAHTRTVDLHGRTVTPGIIDSHSHPTSYGMKIFQPDLSQQKSLAEIIQTIGAKVQQSKPGEWITNSRIWNESKLVERRNPTRYDIDAVSPNNPVFLSRGHLGVANSAALKAAGIDRNSPDPPGGTIEKDPQTGEPTGRLYERAQDVFRKFIPPPTREQLMQAQLQAYKELAEAGVTSVRSAADSPEGMRAFIELRKRDQIPLRTAVNIRLNPNQPKEDLERWFRDAPVASGLGDDMLNVWGIKMVADGGSDLAYLRRDYVNRPGFRGQPGGTRENFIMAARLCNKYGWRVGVHALGDAAIDMVLDAYEAADHDNSIVGKRWSIEHGYMLQPDHFDRIKKLGLVMHPQTWHLYNLRRNFLENYGRDYAEMSHPYRKLLDRGIPISGGTDWQMDHPYDQFFYMWVAISRKTIDGEVVGADQKLTREEALRFHTIWAAYSTFEENKKGSLEPGKFADLVVISADYLTVPEDQIKDITPLVTMVGGKVVFQKDASIMGPAAAAAAAGGGR
jgi:predicted amidohydrolase YtcJ